MSVYVDESKWPFRGQLYCHMIADTHDELLAFAMQIGLNVHWIQKAGNHQEHFDLAPSKRAAAVRHGAIEISGRELSMRCVERAGAYS